MSKIITAEMMNNLPYTCENQVPIQKIESDNSQEFDEEIYCISGRATKFEVTSSLIKIKEHIDSLARIESENNYVPLERAKKAFERALNFPTVIDELTHVLGKISYVESKKRFFSAQSHIPISSVIEFLLMVVLDGSQFNVLFDSRRKILVNQLLDILECTKTTVKSSVSANSVLNECSMFVFQSSDLDAAAHFICESIEEPLGLNNIKVVYVQEAALECFKTKLQRRLRCYSQEDLNDPLLRQRHSETMKILKKLNADTIRPLNSSEDDVTPVVCYEFDLSYFPTTSSVVILKVFRTVKEAVSLAKRNGISLTSIWTENLALAYEVVKSLDCTYFWINCLGVKCDLWKKLSILEFVLDKESALKAMGQSGVSIENSHHFEYFLDEGHLKYVAFPFGVTFAN